LQVTLLHYGSQCTFPSLTFDIADCGRILLDRSKHGRQGQERPGGESKQFAENMKKSYEPNVNSLVLRGGALRHAQGQTFEYALGTNEKGQETNDDKETAGQIGLDHMKAEESSENDNELDLTVGIWK